MVFASRAAEIGHFGSALGEAELEALKAAAQQQIAAAKLELGLGLGLGLELAGGRPAPDAKRLTGRLPQQ